MRTIRITTRNAGDLYEAKADDPTDPHHNELVMACVGASPDEAVGYVIRELYLADMLEGRIKLELNYAHT